MVRSYGTQLFFVDIAGLKSGVTKCLEPMALKEVQCFFKAIGSIHIMCFEIDTFSSCLLVRGRSKIVPALRIQKINIIAGWFISSSSFVGAGRFYTGLNHER